MKIVFLSNYYNHHQAPFCEAMYERLGEDFLFIQTKELSTERINLGWGEKMLPLFVKKNYEGAAEEQECRELIENADAVIIGTAPNSLVKNRIKKGKLVVRYGERQFKKGLELWKYPYRYLKWHKKNPKGANIYLLCASAYAAADYSKVGVFQNRCYKWGYFPAVKRYNNINQLIELKHPASIIWVARLIEWKHPEIPVLVAKRLKDENYFFEIKMIGNGKLEEKIQKMIQELGVSDCVKMLGAMTPREVREHMEQSQIFLHTADRNEGWGAVLNEAMNSACGVIASDAIGASPYLIKEGVNGLMYGDGDFEEVYRKVKLLLDEPDQATKLGKNAYETMINEWNAEAASDRLLELIYDLKTSGKSDRFLDGPCSEATILKDGWYKCARKN